MPASNPQRSSIPCLRYRDAHAAIDWLRNAFGFTRNAVYENEQGGVEHVQLTFGNGMVMLGDVRASEFGRHIAQPDEIGRRETPCACVIVADCQAHYLQAKSAGAVIVDDYSDKEYGGGYSCHDPWQPDQA
ncbi:MAG: VOC family protein [Rhodanobacter sp.]